MRVAALLLALRLSPVLSCRACPVAAVDYKLATLEGMLRSYTPLLDSANVSMYIVEHASGFFVATTSGTPILSSTVNGSFRRLRAADSRCKRERESALLLSRLPTPWHVNASGVRGARPPAPACPGAPCGECVSVCSRFRASARTAGSASRSARCRRRRRRAQVDMTALHTLVRTKTVRGAAQLPHRCSELAATLWARAPVWPARLPYSCWSRPRARHNVCNHSAVLSLSSRAHGADVRGIAWSIVRLDHASCQAHEQYKAGRCSCEAGHYTVGGRGQQSQHCVLCGAGKYSASSGASACTACPGAGTQPNARHDRCVCKPGSFPGFYTWRGWGGALS